jgi:hypothetical protein
MGFLFEHKKRTVLDNPGGEFVFEHKKRLISNIPTITFKIAVGGAFSEAFDAGSFFVELQIGVASVLHKFNEFIFKQIKSTR